VGKIYQQCPLQSLSPACWHAPGVSSGPPPVNFLHPQNAHKNPSPIPQFLLHRQHMFHCFWLKIDKIDSSRPPPAHLHQLGVLLLWLENGY
jgi:hypothetical protein